MSAGRPQRQPDREVAPVVQRVRVHHAKRGRLRFSSHRDFQRALERAIRRAGVPIAFSAGFSPHPRISYAGAAPTGVASEAEYLELALSQHVDPNQLALALDAALPPGFDVIEVVEAATSDFVARLEVSSWLIELPDLARDQVEAAGQLLWAADQVEVSRMTKSGLRTFDARSALVHLGGEQANPAGCGILQVVVRHCTPAVRPDDVLSALRQVADLVPLVPPVVTRLAQGPLMPDGRSVGDPLVADREFVAGSG
ncbi:MAG: TIGR03936 family radical SAM-associated protein [Actinomycetes bacterium]